MQFEAPNALCNVRVRTFDVLFAICVNIRTIVSTVSPKKKPDTRVKCCKFVHDHPVVPRNVFLDGWELRSSSLHAKYYSLHHILFFE